MLYGSLLMASAHGRDCVEYGSLVLVVICSGSVKYCVLMLRRFWNSFLDKKMFQGVTSVIVLVLKSLIQCI